MIKNLKIKFIVSIMSILTIVLILIFTAFNLIIINSGTKQSLNLLQEIANKEGLIIKNNRPNDFKTRHSFAIKISVNNEILEIINPMNSLYTDDEIITKTNKVFKKNKSFGNIDQEKYLIQEKIYGKIIVFIDNSFELNLKSRLFITSFIIGSISLISIFFISVFLSNWAIKPVKESFLKQKQFVADASHELKTPISIISANTDILLNEFQENKWLEYIKYETNRMNLLVNNLLYLAQNDSFETKLEKKSFNLSNLVLQTTLPFESIAFEANLILNLNIEQNIKYIGDEFKITQVLIILLDNAIKNTKNGIITVNLTKKNNKILFKIKNTHQGLSKEDQIKIFERFYRSDISRNRETGGYGLGLPIAKAIIEAHHAKINVYNEDNCVVFVLNL